MARPTRDERWARNVRSGDKVLIRLEGLHFIANGVFSNVYEGSLVIPQQKMVVVKKTWSKGRDLPREVEILSLIRKLHLPNIVQLLYTFANRDHPDNKVCHGLVFEHMPMTLYKHAKGLRVQKMKMNLVDVKLYTWQLFNAQSHLAHHSICHRDIKPQNILIDPKSGLLKLADFGSSKCIVNARSRNTHYQVTRHYRPPELLLQAEEYGTEIDVWSCGCVFGELLRGSLLMHGDTTFEQFSMILTHLGLPTTEDYSAMKCRRNVFDLKKVRIAGNKFGDLVPDAPLDAVDLLNRILVYNPKKRLCGDELLADHFFEEIFSPAAIRTNGYCVRLFNSKDEHEVAAHD